MAAPPLIFRMGMAALLLAGCKSGGKASGGDDGGVDAGALGSCPMNPDDLISDFTADNGIQPADGRSGGWYVYGDMLGTFDPPKMGDAPYPIDPTVGNPYCDDGPGSFHIKGTGFALWGAAAATDLVPQVAPMMKGSYDATKYKGISFWIRASTTLPFVSVKFPDIHQDVDVPSPQCVLSAIAANNCSPYLVKLGIPAEFPKYGKTKVDTTWRQIQVLFADAQQDMFNPGAPSPNNVLDVAHLLGVAIQVNANFTTMPTTANNFDVWIDDVEFMR